MKFHHNVIVKYNRNIYRRKLQGSKNIKTPLLRLVPIPYEC